MSNARIRKQVYELTAEDLDRYPVWEFALGEEGVEGQDEATVRPYEASGGADAPDGLFIVRASLTLADGTRIRGYLMPPLAGDASLGFIQPTAVLGSGQVSFWCGICAPDASYIAENYARLGKSSAAQVFPLHFESDTAWAGGPITGEVPGFVVLEDQKTMRTSVIT